MQHQPEDEDGIIDYHQQVDSTGACGIPDDGSLQQAPLQQGEVAALEQQQVQETEPAQQDAAQVARPVMQHTPPADPDVLSCAGVCNGGTLAAAAVKRWEPSVRTMGHEP
jgi:hypothetical protein